MARWIPGFRAAVLSLTTSSGLVLQGWLHAWCALSVTKQVRMARVLRAGEHDNGSFDRAFWREVGHEGIFEAAWELVNEYRTFRRLDGDEPRLQRSVSRVIRPGG